MKNRVYFKDDGFVEIEGLAPRFDGIEESAKTPEHLVGVNRVLMNTEDLPRPGSSPAYEHWDQCYHKGDGKLYVDLEWKERLMPTSLICKKHLRRLSSKIDAELAKPTPDAVQLFKWKNELDTLRRMSRGGTEVEQDVFDRKLYSQALANLVEDGHDKPIIVQKLNDKITELETETANNAANPTGATGSNQS